MNLRHPLTILCLLFLAVAGTASASPAARVVEIGASDAVDLSRTVGVAHMDRLDADDLLRRHPGAEVLVLSEEASARLTAGDLEALADGGKVLVGAGTSLETVADELGLDFGPLAVSDLATDSLLEDDGGERIWAFARGDGDSWISLDGWLVDESATDLILAWARDLHASLTAEGPMAPAVPSTSVQTKSDPCSPFPIVWDHTTIQHPYGASFRIYNMIYCHFDGYNHRFFGNANTTTASGSFDQVKVRGEIWGNTGWWHMLNFAEASGSSSAYLPTNTLAGSKPAISNKNTVKSWHRARKGSFEMTVYEANCLGSAC